MLIYIHAYIQTFYLVLCDLYSHFGSTSNLMMYGKSKLLGKCPVSIMKGNFLKLLGGNFTFWGESESDCIMISKLILAPKSEICNNSSLHLLWIQIHFWWRWLVCTYAVAVTDCFHVSIALFSIAKSVVVSSCNIYLLYYIIY